ncbi:50S ribosomal protein L24e [Natronobeatus ordinarius]|uniref:50S ribosomal protein L24e n=1 Tax=Natronobeatus ordinarius TaxID=2963433 RepID=UPI0020CF7A92|nr:50S ribosomal protein L24e [Natronobeatus ordinarius]
MVEKRTCDYTGEEIEPGTGIMYVQKDGTVLHFVDSKAEKNYLLGREPRDLEWTAEGRRGKGPVQAQAEEADEEVDETEAVEEDETEEAEAEEEDEAEEAEAEEEDEAEEGEAEEEEAEAEAEEADK